MYRQALKAIYVLLISVALLTWLENKSINLYWQQTYHTDSPFNVLDQFPLWSKGAQLNDQLVAEEDHLLAQVAEINKDVVDSFNSDILQIPVNEEPILEQALTASEIEQNEKTIEEELYSGKVALNSGDKVFYVGDSLMQGVAPHLRTTLFKTYGIEGIDLSKQSTGLAYVNYFNWPKLVEDTLAENSDIRLIIVYLGPNDPWDFPLEKGKPYLKFQSQEWEEVYRSRVKDIIASAKKHNAKLIWLSPPNMKKKKLSEAMNYLSSLFEQEVKESKEISIPTNGILGCETEEYANFVEIDGKKIKVRVDDGIHFTTSGQKIIAEKVLSYIHVKQESVLDNEEKQKISN